MHSFRHLLGLRRSRWSLCATLWLGLMLGGFGASAQDLPQAPVARTGSVTGSVVDPDEAVVGGARLFLVVDATKQSLETLAAADGTFRLEAVPAGAFTITAAAGNGLAPGKMTGVALPGQTVALAPIVLRVASEDTEVTALSQHDAAEIEVKTEEKQRILGVLPNFGVSYNWHAPPMDVKQKFELATREVISPFTFGVNAAVVGIDRATGNFDEFGPGAKGYWYLYGATMADVAIGSELGGAVFPWIFHQDPRYFWKGTGSLKSRAWYAITRTVICRDDKGRNVFSYSGVLGNYASGAFSNVYYPSVDRTGLGLTLRNGSLAIAFDALGNLEQEFLFKWFTPGSRKKKPVDGD